MTDYLAMGFRDVDALSEVGKFVACLEFMDRLTSFREYKKAMVEKLGVSSGTHVLDIGCGVGFDTMRLAELAGPHGISVGMDPSATLLESATRNAGAQTDLPRFVRGFGECLPFGDETFDAVRVDRTLQHVSDPHTVLCEMFRVIKPGGRIACAEPDWGTLVITGTDTELTRKVVETWCDGFRNGWIGRWLMPMLGDIGFVRSEVSGYLLVAEGFSAADVMFDIKTTLRRLGAHEAWHERCKAWLREIKAQPHAFASVTLFLATGMKPQRDCRSNP